jgi:DNA-binding beta-propeller fold protein YncE
MRPHLRIRRIALSGALIFSLCLALILWQWERVYPFAALILPLDAAPAATIPQLVLEESIPLGDVKGRIDHMTFDPGHKRLFIAELGNNTISVADLQNRRVEARLAGFDEPQGLGFVRETDTLFIANGGNGLVEMRRGSDFSLIKQIALGSDADNIRADERGRTVIAGYGDGGLAVLDAATGEKTRDIRLAAHPESFQIDALSQRIFVNEPKAFRITVIGYQTGKEIARWGASGAASNFAMTLDVEGQRLFAVYRLPALLTVFDTATGELIDKQATCGDADDAFYDANRKRVYVICGDGSIAVVAAAAKRLVELSRLATWPGARTGLYVPDLDTLFVAAPAKGAKPAEVLIYRPR